MQQHSHSTHQPDEHFRRIQSQSKTRYDDFYNKLERIRLSASSKQCVQRSATELLDESKAFFVKSQEVLRQRQSLNSQHRSNEQKPVTSFFRMPQPRRSPYLDSSSSSDRMPFDSLDLALRSSTSPLTNSTTDYSDGGIFESVSLLSLSDQTTLDSVTTPSPINRTVVSPTSLSVIERNARIIKWLFQLNKANACPSFQTVQ